MLCSLTFLMVMLHPIRWHAGSLRAATKKTHMRDANASVREQETSDDYRKQLEEAEARAEAAEATAAAEKEQCQRMLEAAAGGPRAAAASPASALPTPVCRLACACAGAGLRLCRCWHAPSVPFTFWPTGWRLCLYSQQVAMLVC